MATYFVRADAAGGSDGLTAAADRSWTWAEFMTAFGATISAGDIVYLVAKGGQFDLTSADAPTRDGTQASPITVAGCYEAAGDLDIVTYNADGSLNVTNWPVVSYTGASGRFNGAGADGVIYRNYINKVLDYNGNGFTMGGNCVSVSMRFEYNGTGGNGLAVSAGTIGDLIDCDVVMGGASGGYCAIDIGGADVTNCRILSWNTRGIRVSASSGSITGCLIRSGVGSAIEWSSTTTTHEPPSIKNNTILGATIGISMPNANHQRIPQITNNVIVHCTTAGIQSAYDGTAQLAAIIRGNRFRNNGVDVNGYDNWATGSAEALNNTYTAGSNATDFVNPTANDYRARPNSPIATAGIGRVSAGSAGALGRGGVLVRPGRAGRF